VSPRSESRSCRRYADRKVAPDHLGIVDDKLIARLQKVREIGNDVVFEQRVVSGCTTSSRAESRGDAGRNAMRSGGNSKSEEIGGARVS